MKQKMSSLNFMLPGVDTVKTLPLNMTNSQKRYVNCHSPIENKANRKFETISTPYYYRLYDFKMNQSHFNL